MVLVAQEHLMYQHHEHLSFFKIFKLNFMGVVLQVFTFPIQSLLVKHKIHLVPDSLEYLLYHHHDQNGSGHDFSIERIQMIHYPPLLCQFYQSNHLLELIFELLLDHFSRRNCSRLGPRRIFDS